MTSAKLWARGDANGRVHEAAVEAHRASMPTSHETPAAAILDPPDSDLCAAAESQRLGLLRRFEVSQIALRPLVLAALSSQPRGSILEPSGASGETPATRPPITFAQGSVFAKMGITNEHERTVREQACSRTEVCVRVTESNEHERTQGVRERPHIYT